MQAVPPPAPFDQHSPCPRVRAASVISTRSKSLAGHRDQAQLDTEPKELVRTGVRLRPYLTLEREREGEAGHSSCVTIAGNSRVILTDKQRELARAFTCDFAFDSSDPASPQYADQKIVYDGIGARIVDDATNGFNCCLCAYGQTGTGKTHTLFGDFTHGKDRGLLLRLAEGLFSHFGALDTIARLWVSYIEIYNNRLRDLLRSTIPANAMGCGEQDDHPILSGSEGVELDGGHLKIRTRPTGGVYVKNLVELEVHRPEDVFRSVALGERARYSAATSMNQNSSRSHGIFKIRLEFCEAADCDDGVRPFRSTSSILVVDLAGRENEQTSEAVGERFRELTFINRSLFELANCVHALSEGSGREHVPFRNSKLTMLLSESFQRNSRTCVLATLTPSASGYEDNLLTCRFLEATGQIETHPLANHGNADDRLKDKLDVARKRLLCLEQVSEAAEASRQSSKEPTQQLERNEDDIRQACAEAARSLNEATQAMQRLDRVNAEIAASIVRAETRLGGLEAAVRMVELDLANRVGGNSSRRRQARAQNAGSTAPQNIETALPVNAPVVSFDIEMPSMIVLS